MSRVHVEVRGQLWGAGSLHLPVFYGPAHQALLPTGHLSDPAHSVPKFSLLLLWPREPAGATRNTEMDRTEFHSRGQQSVCQHISGVWLSGSGEATVREGSLNLKREY